MDGDTQVLVESQSPPDCHHLIRTRDNNCGFASAETICVNCGQGFDAERERELRERDHMLRHDAPRVGVGEGYSIG
jgi:hypothetical protein